MPIYEMPLLCKIMTRPELVACLKRTADIVLKKGGIIHKIDNLGTRDIPFKISEHGQVHKKASYFIFTFQTSPAAMNDLLEESGRDVDIVRRRVYKAKPPTNLECTLEEETLPPAYRKEVQEMINKSKSKEKPKFDYKSGLDYYPFQR